MPKEISKNVGENVGENCPWVSLSVPEWELVCP